MDFRSLHWLNWEVAADEGEITEAGEGEDHVKEKKTVLKKVISFHKCNSGGI